MTGGHTRRLAHRTAWGFLWSVTGTVLARGLALLSLIVLARILAPSEYGLFAVALIFLTYLETVGDLGTGVALVYWPDRVTDAAQVTFAVNLATGVVLTALTIHAAPAVAAFFRTPDAAPLLRVLAWSFLIRSLGNTHDALCKKNLRFRARLVPELGMAAVKAAFAVALALAGFGVWSLVWGQLAGAAVATLLLWRIIPWRPRWHWPTGLAVPMLTYGGGIVAVNMLAAVVHHLDALVVARALGAEALGLYQIAYRIPEIIVSLLVWQAGKVLFPAYARLNAAGGDLAGAYVASLRYMMLLAGPMAVGLFIVAEPVVTALFGAAWSPAAPVLRALAVMAALRALGSQTGEMVKAVGRSGLLAGLSALKAGLLVPALLVAASHGIGGVAWAVAGVGAVTTLLNLVVSARLVGVRAGALVLGVWPGAATTALTGAAVLGARLLLPDAAPLVVLAAALAVGAGAFAAGVALVAPHLVTEVRAVLAGGPRREVRGVLAGAAP